MHLQAGKLRNRIELQRSVATQSATGEVTHTWHTITKVWASVEPLSGREYLQAQQIQAETTHLVRMRHFAGVTVTPKDRLKWGSRVFGIENAINVEERNREVVMQVKEEVA